MGPRSLKEPTAVPRRGVTVAGEMIHMGELNVGVYTVAAEGVCVVEVKELRPSIHCRGQLSHMWKFSCAELGNPPAIMGYQELAIFRRGWHKFGDDVRISFASPR